MNCYQHQEKTSFGLCKLCQKAVCALCAKDTGKGLACSDFCVKELAEQNQILEKSKQIYSIGRKSRLPATGVLAYIFMGLVFAGIGFFPLTQGEHPEPMSALMGSGFLFFGVLAYIRNRKLNINC